MKPRREFPWGLLWALVYLSLVAGAVVVGQILIGVTDAR